MLKKNDLLPVILALISTGIVLGFALMLFIKIFHNNSKIVKNDELSMYQETRAEVKSINDDISQAALLPTFPAPGIVPQGTLININSSIKSLEINKALRKSFQKQFPGTVVNTNVDNEQAGIELLRSGQIHLAAIDRPLSSKEKAPGLVVVPLDSTYSDKNGVGKPTKLYYAYQEPASLEVEAFLGYAFSAEGQQAILSDNN